MKDITSDGLEKEWLYSNFSIYYVKNLCPLPQKSEILYIRKKHYSACLFG